jgi:hypothetical protein
MRARALQPALLWLSAATLAAAPSAAQPPSVEPAGFHLIGLGGLTSGLVLCPNESPPFAHWDLRQFPQCGVPFEVNGTIGAPGNPTAAQAAAEVAAAAATWSGVSPSHLRLLDTSAQSSAACSRAPARDNRNCVAWDPAFPFGSGVLGVTYLWRIPASGTMLESDITLNPMPAGSTWRVMPPPTSCGALPVGIRAVALHEFGHFLGLHHPDQYSNPAGCGDDDPGDTTVMYAYYTNACEVSLSQPDIDGANYLYTYDLGDHPDPPYPTRVHSGVPSGQVLSHVALETPGSGPAHLYGIHSDPAVANQPRYQYEWLGRRPGGRIDDHPQECEARPVDNYDDGVSILERCVNGTVQGQIGVILHVRTERDVRGRRHSYTAANRMYLNGWFDWNVDGDFRDPGEHAIGTGVGVGVSRGGAFPFRVQPPPNTPCGVPSRFRLDWREDVGQVTAFDPTLNLEMGEAQHGEVEDYTAPARLHPHNEYCHPVPPVPVFFPGVGVVIHWRDLCHGPQPFEEDVVTAQLFEPTAADECLDSTLCGSVDLEGDGIDDEQLCLGGPVCIHRDVFTLGEDGLKVIPTEMVSLDVSGYSEFAGELRIRLATPEGFSTFGEIRQSPEAADLGIDISEETPASSFFDVFFVIESELLGASEVVGPLRVDAHIASVPPGVLYDPTTNEEPPPDPDNPPPDSGGIEF